MPNVIPLKPARPDIEGPVPSYGPRVPWRWIVPILTLTLLGAGGYWLRRQAQMNSLRQEIKAAHAALNPVAKPYLALTQKIEQWTLDAIAKPVTKHIDPRLDLNKLHKGQGIYLRVPLKLAKSKQDLHQAIAAAEDDSLASCLGIKPGLVSDLFAKGNFLRPAWITRVDTSNNPVRLRVMDDELVQRSKRDLPVITELLKSEWFMLVVQHGDNRRDAPVDVHLWGLSPKVHLLSATVQANGLIVTARNNLAPGAPRMGATKVKVGTGAANDCSIATQLQQLASPTMESSQDG